MHDEFSRRQFFTGLSRTLIIMNFSFGGGWVLGWGWETGAGAVAYQLKPLPAVPATHLVALLVI